MRLVVAALALVVAVEYAVIAVDVVPRLARMAGSGARAMTIARWAAAAFFVGCAFTQIGVAVQLLHAPAQVDGDRQGRFLFVVQHVAPRVAQVLGAAAFIVVAKRNLVIDVVPKAVAARLHELELQIRIAFDRAPTGIVLLALGDEDVGRVVRVNPAACALLRRAAEELVGRTFRELVHPDDRWRNVQAQNELKAGRCGVVEVEERLLARDGAVWTAIEASVLRDDDRELRYAVLQIRDIEEERRQRTRLQHLAEHDSLTDAYNRRRFEEELDAALARAQRYGEECTLLMVDLDQFKYVNDTYGHRVGDELLRRVAGVLRGRLRETDVLGRLGGDEFGVLCACTGVEDARTIADALLTALREHAYVEVDERVVRAGASIGIREVGGQGRSAEQVLAEADVAMYESKARGRDRVTVYDDDAGRDATSLRHQVTWSERIRDAIADNRLRLYEQPILNLTTGRADRSELLVRMIHPEDGSIVLPGQFLDTAERFGQVQAIDRWVFRQALQLLACRQRQGDERIVEVNLSGVSVSDPAVVDELAELLTAIPVTPGSLVVEITETAAIDNMELARTAAVRLAGLGCRFALDDFGSGFGSFYYLKHLPFHGVKVDGDFVKDLPSSPHDRLTVEAIVTIAHGLGKETTAEYVQDSATLAILRELGVGYAQGYHVGRPAPVPGVPRLVST